MTAPLRIFIGLDPRQVIEKSVVSFHDFGPLGRARGLLPTKWELPGVPAIPPRMVPGARRRRGCLAPGPSL